MANANLEINFEQAAEKFEMNCKVGYKKVTLRTEDCCVEAAIVDLDRKKARAQWITTRRGANVNYKDIVAMLESVEYTYPEPQPTVEESVEAIVEKVEATQPEIISYVEVAAEFTNGAEVTDEAAPKDTRTKFEILQSIVDTANLDGLSEQELEIVTLVKLGMNLDEISQRLGLARSTVEDKIRGRSNKPGIVDKLTA